MQIQEKITLIVINKYLGRYIRLWKRERKQPIQDGNNDCNIDNSKKDQEENIYLWFGRPNNCQVHVKGEVPISNGNDHDFCTEGNDDEFSNKQKRGIITIHGHDVQKKWTKVDKSGFK